MKDGGPAFPQRIERPNGLMTETTTYFGMSLRDYFAAAALQGQIASMTNADVVRQLQAMTDDPWRFCADSALKFADAMIAARGESE